MINFAPHAAQHVHLPHVWLGKPAQPQLLALQYGLAVHALVRIACKTTSVSHAKRQDNLWKRARRFQGDQASSSTAEVKLLSVVQWQEPSAGHCWVWAFLVATQPAGDDMEDPQLRRQRPLVHFLEASWVTWPSLSSLRPRREELV